MVLEYEMVLQSPALRLLGFYRGKLFSMGKNRKMYVPELAALD